MASNADVTMREVPATGAVIQKCAAQHFGPWMVETQWFERAVAAVKAGLYTSYRPDAAADRVPREGDSQCTAYLRTSDGIAVISIEGQMTKGESSFGGGTSTVRTRQAIRQAMRDPETKGIMLLVDSPGGTCAGTAELAADVAAAAKVKPLHAHIEDLGASAAYWVASQANYVTATPTSLVGSIGTVAVVEDSSGQMAKEGVVVHVVSTGAYKGAFTSGAPVSEEHLKYLQSYVNGLNEHFLAGVAGGRKMPMEQVRKAADGRIHLAADAKAMGLLDAVCGQDQAMEDLRGAVRRATTGVQDMSIKSAVTAAVNAVASLVAGTSAAGEVPAAAQAAAGASSAEPVIDTAGAKAVEIAKQPEAPSAAPATPAPAATEPSAAAGGAAGVAAAAPAAPAATPAAPPDPKAEARAECKRFVDAFGPAGATWFAEGKTLAEAQELHMAALKADNTRLAEEVVRLKADGSARGEPSPVSFHVDGAAGGTKPDLASKIGPNMARVAAGLKFAKKQG